ncbi:hypothetical protein QOZ80_7BG0608160 [Eleusine coracana subsp. coracana]|nr:hypothetical protein QOZ80_7BG0608160 [Eleusine coracana subsp. coracana]
MIKQQDDTITHFSHPGHELVKRHYAGPFRCDMCLEGLTLTGPAYGCLTGCDFAIHDSCAAHPHTLSSPAHPPHSLVLLQTRPDDVAHACDVCTGFCAPGSFLYRCPPCGFNMHPSCARLPRVVRSARHMEHDLTLVVVAEGRCAACRGGGATFYRCAACNVDFHVACAATAGDNSSSSNAHHQARSDQMMSNAHVQQAAVEAAQMQAVVARNLQAELQLARIKAQRDMNFAATMNNAGVNIASLFYPGSTVVPKNNNARHFF